MINGPSETCIASDGGPAARERLFADPWWRPSFRTAAAAPRWPGSSRRCACKAAGAKIEVDQIDTPVASAEDRERLQFAIDHGFADLAHASTDPDLTLASRRSAVATEGTLIRRDPHSAATSDSDVAVRGRTPCVRGPKWRVGDDLEFRLLVCSWIDGLRH